MLTSGRLLTLLHMCLSILQTVMDDACCGIGEQALKDYTSELSCEGGKERDDAGSFCKICPGGMYSQTLRAPRALTAITTPDM